MLEDITEFILPKGWTLVQAAQTKNKCYWLILCRRTSDGMHVTWEYNSQSLCYWGHYDWSLTMAELEFTARLSAANL